MYINYQCLVHEGIELHIASPETEESNTNQYVIHIKGLKDYLNSGSTLIIVGDWEFREFKECLKQVVQYLDDGMKTLQKTIHPKIHGTLEMGLFRKSDQPSKVRLKLDFNDQEPYANGAVWKGMTTKEFAIYISVNELTILGKLFERFVYESDQPERIIKVTRSDWAFPREIAYGNNPVLLESNRRDVINEIRSKVPSALSTILVNLIHTENRYSRETAVCPTCQGTFIRNALWMRQCHGCYQGGRPTAIKKKSDTTTTGIHWIQSAEDVEEANL